MLIRRPRINGIIHPKPILKKGIYFSAIFIIELIKSLFNSLEKTYKPSKKLAIPVNSKVNLNTL